MKCYIIITICGIGEKLQRTRYAHNVPILYYTTRSANYRHHVCIYYSASSWLHPFFSYNRIWFDYTRVHHHHHCRCIAIYYYNIIIYMHSYIVILYGRCCPGRNEYLKIRIITKSRITGYASAYIRYYYSNSRLIRLSKRPV